MTSQSTYPRVEGKCGACGSRSLFLGAGGFVTCGYAECSDPTFADDLLHGKRSDLWTEAPMPNSSQRSEVSQVSDVSEAPMSDLYRIDKMSHNDVRDAARLLGVSPRTMVAAIDIMREWLVPVSVDDLDREAAKIKLHEILREAGVSVIVNSDLILEAALGGTDE